MELTNEQVIEWLRFAQKRMKNITYSPETFYAIEKAIDVIQYTSGTNVGDLISRKAAIDAFEMNCYPIRYDHNSIEKGMTITGIKQVLDELPPVQTEIIRCKDCKHLFNKNDEGGKCWHFNGFSKVVSYDDFCSRAERRTDGTN